MTRTKETTQTNDSGVTLGDADFKAIRELIYDRFGINLTEGKRTLVAGRLQSVLRQRGYTTFAEYLTFVLKDTSGDALDELANRISTNHTFFYREEKHFEFFKDRALPEITARLEAENNRDLRIWCAGCSSGEEPYTLVMLMLEYFGSSYSKWQAGLLATDISGNALRIATAGVYPGERLEKMPQNLKTKYFTRRGDEYQVKDVVKKEITFRRHNLMNEQYPFKKPFDLVFCRNVMIYFDTETRQALVNRFARHNKPGGYLFIGHSETLGRDNDRYKYVMPALYSRKDDNAR